MNTYYITQASDLNLIQNDRAGHYILMNDIDCKGHSHSSANSSSGTASFQGIFDGQGYTISNLTIEALSPNVGFINYIGVDGVLKNIKFTNYTITNNTTSLRNIGLVGGCEGIIHNVYVQGNATVLDTSNYVGGLVGITYNTAKIHDCFIDMNLKGARTSSGLVVSVPSVNAQMVAQGTLPQFNNIVALGTITAPSTLATNRKGALGGVGAWADWIIPTTANVYTTYPNDVKAQSRTLAQLKEPSLVPLSNQWTHAQGELPVLNLVAIDESVNVREEIVNVPYLMPSVTVERVKKVTRPITPFEVKTSLSFSKRLKTQCTILMQPYIVNAQVSNINYRTYKFNVALALSVNTKVYKRKVQKVNVQYVPYNVVVIQTDNQNLDKAITAIAQVIRNSSVGNAITNYSVVNTNTNTSISEVI